MRRRIHFKKLPTKSTTLSNKIRNDNPWGFRCNDDKLSKELADIIDNNWTIIKERNDALHNDRNNWDLITRDNSLDIPAIRSFGSKWHLDPSHIIDIIIHNYV